MVSLLKKEFKILQDFFVESHNLFPLVINQARKNII